MKLTLFLSTIFLLNLCNQSAPTSQASAGAPMGMTTKFKVYGNCGMCEKRIEKAAKKLDGVSSADWNEDTKILTVTFDETKLKPSQIHTAVAAVGHDTEMARADDAVYAELPECCQYERAPRQ